MRFDNEKKMVERLAEIGEGFTLERVIGEGTVGTVCECRGRDGSRVAVKLMELTPMGTPLAFEEIIKAALATKPIAEEACIVRVFSAGKLPPSTYYIVMEMMEGGTLEAHAAKVKLPLKKKLDLSAKIADSIFAIHSKGIIHGDLKPSNILLDKDGEPYLNDFYLYSHSSRPTPFMSIGTPFYMSPEQATGALVTPITDIYTFGVLFYELLTGEMPYSSGMDSIGALIEEITNGNIIPPAKRDSKLRGKLEAVMIKLLEKDPDRRYRDMALAAADIRSCLNGSDISIPYEKSFWSRLFKK
jgi:serine/threonine-protein kinase